MRLRVLIAVTHLLGAGHLTRAAAIGRALAGAGHAVTLVSGGMPTPLVPLTGLKAVQLPPVRAAIGAFTRLLGEDGQPASPDRMEARRHGLLDAFERAQPDVIVTELYPFGRRVLAGEFDALLDAAHAARPRPWVLASLRDILAAPGRPEKAAATQDLVVRRYDGVLVHGDERFIPLDASWPVDDALRRRLHYTGYVDAEPAGYASAEPSDKLGDTVLVSGGSSAAALPLYRAALAAAERDGRPWRILVGRGVDAVETEALRASCPPTVTLEPARRDFRALLARSAVLVGQAGYNTVMDVAATRIRAVLVPFEAGHETEQRLRAEHLASRGAAIVLPEFDLDADTLADAIAQARRLARPDFGDLNVDGAAGTVGAIERLASGHPDNRG